ncbi:MAG: hypothetical protein GYA33_07700 [Thermogutta sp.]|nr:hypothetical protein [Thermogutta sp.]
MNPAIWKKAIWDGWSQFVVSSLLLFGFAWLFVWLNSLVNMDLWVRLLDFLPPFAVRAIGIPLKALASPMGRISVLFVHIVPLLVMMGWAVGRNSELVSGGISNGTLEVLLTVPVRRVHWIWVPAVVWACQACLLTGALWLGLIVGLRVLGTPNDVSHSAFLPGVVNLVCMTFCLSGITAALSAADNNRWRTIWLATGIFIVATIIKMVARMWEPGAWLAYFSFLSAFEPQLLILVPEQAARLMWRYNGALLGVGLLGYVAAAVMLARRDIPVPR